MPAVLSGDSKGRRDNNCFKVNGIVRNGVQGRGVCWLCFRAELQRCLESRCNGDVENGENIGGRGEGLVIGTPLRSVASGVQTASA